MFILITTNLIITLFTELQSSRDTSLGLIDKPLPMPRIRLIFRNTMISIVVRSDYSSSKIA